MVQEFHVLRCFSCQSFQVQQVKKVNRWSCKLCGEKQSLLKEFGRGSGADCRRHVQKLNAMRGAVMEEQECNTWLLWEKVEEEDEPEEQRDVQVSRWNKYLQAPEEADPETGEEDNILMDRQQLHGNNVLSRKRKRRDGWTDRQRQDGWTPEQSNCVGEPVRPTTTTNMSHTSPPSVSTGPVRRWAQFLSSDCQEDEKGVEYSASGWSQSDSSLSCCDITDQTPPLSRLRPLLLVSSMFQSGDDFSFDEFLTTDKI